MKVKKKTKRKLQRKLLMMHNRKKEINSLERELKNKWMDGWMDDAKWRLI
jgi:hypothetical protein